MKKIVANEHIRFDKVSVIDHTGKNIGILASRAAKDLARNEDLDLILIDATQDPPVCRITDLGKYVYQMNKKMEHKPKRTMVKEVQVRPITEKHDLEVKARQIAGFLAEGHRVKVVMRFEGREVTHRNVGQHVWDFIKSGIAESGFFEKEPRFERRTTVGMIVPGKPKNQLKQQATQTQTQTQTQPKPKL